MGNPTNDRKMVYSMGLELRPEDMAGEQFDTAFRTPAYSAAPPQATTTVDYAGISKEVRLMPPSVRRVLEARNIVPSAGTGITAEDVAALDGIPATVFVRGGQYKGWGVEKLPRKIEE